VLLGADLTTFWLLGWVLNAVRDQGLLGVEVGELVGRWIPRSYLGGLEFASALVVGLVVTGNYGPGDRRRNVGRLLAGVALAVALTIWSDLWQLGPVVPLTFGLVVGLLGSGLVLERLAIDRAILALGWRRPFARTLFVGSTEECHAAMSRPGFRRGARYRPVGLVPVEASDPGGLLEKIRTALLERRAETLVICGYLPDEVFTDVVVAADEAGRQLLAVPRRFGQTGMKPQLVWDGDQPLVEFVSPHLKAPQFLVKRVTDLACSAIGLLGMMPLFLAVAVAIKLDSPGPVFFWQERVGRGGRRFRVWKFRTMWHGVSDSVHREFVTGMISGESEAARRNCNSNGAPVHKLVHDNRVTRVGAFLRRTSLDELPQLFNVLRGDMSMVGPRPPLPYEVEEYEQWQFGRLRMVPGITGLWQVSGRSRLTYREMCELDIAYVDNWSLWLDAKLMLKTVPVVLFNTGKAN
jgi:exopolysaccharide biosynthesis polyprenyl glycosylphosphotransferase